MAKTKVTFEEAMRILEEKVRLLESGTLSLDDSLKLYEETVSLIRFCSSELEKAKQKVLLLSKDAEGNPVREDFSPDET